MEKTEFFETAVQHGFYGIDKGGLLGKKDNVRKYWEDISIKTAIRQPVIELLNDKGKINIVDFGCGSGEGYELLTHIPPVNKTTTHRDFVLNDLLINQYVGLDISPSMIQQGNNNYSGKDNIRFLQANLAKDLEFFDKNIFDLYFSSYSSPSHLTSRELENLIEKIFRTNDGSFYIALDLFGRFSAEWPMYWNNSADELLPYNMNWLYKNEEDKKAAEDYYVRFWSASELTNLITNLAGKLNRNVTINCIDRSILVGRHIDSGYYNKHPQPLRYEVNKLFDRDYRGDAKNLIADISFLAPFKQKRPEEYNHLEYYLNNWNHTILFLNALIAEDKKKIEELFENASDDLKEELMMLKWLEGNSSRFPVVDFWASIMGPQIACILRNMEFALSKGMGCGHGLFCVIKVF